jgi:hypothetical protein
MILVWTGITLWLGFNAAVVARRAYVTLPDRGASRLVDMHLHRA